ncbi:hypothetical protein FA13DRAFT_622907 [Coprinellus micaceus]|uniref:BTB domain-containing protein n=1 Tax=Coprinellus micaceus TaxID=71717 RepID=A0A4Y7T6W9_COPMI|nr:hypothetical protein FA13DRAFT_622907 [Coprinellus micaceus]
MNLPTTADPAQKPKSYMYQLVSFKVEDRVYRVPRHGFTESSEVFESMFTLPQPSGSKEGESDEHPIELPSCTKLEFESLLEVLYPPAASVSTFVLPR